MNGAMCLALHPGGGDFPARCVRPPHHVGPHTSAGDRGWAGLSWGVEVGSVACQACEDAAVRVLAVEVGASVAGSVPVAQMGETA